MRKRERDANAALFLLPAAPEGGVPTLPLSPRGASELARIVLLPCAGRGEPLGKLICREPTLAIFVDAMTTPVGV